MGEFGPPQMIGKDGHRRLFNAWDIYLCSNLSSLWAYYLMHFRTAVAHVEKFNMAAP